MADEYFVLNIYNCNKWH